MFRGHFPFPLSLGLAEYLFKEGGSRRVPPHSMNVALGVKEKTKGSYSSDMRTQKTHSEFAVSVNDEEQSCRLNYTDVITEAVTR